MITNFLQGLTIFSYFLFHGQTTFILYGVVMIYSLFNQFYSPAEAASLPNVVTKLELPQANSLFFFTLQTSLVVGFGFAGILQSVIGFNGSLLLCSIFLFLAFISTWLLPDIKIVGKPFFSFEHVLKTIYESILEGYEFIRKNKFIELPLILLLGLQACLSMIVVNLPAIASQVLNIPLNLSGVSVVVPAGIGAVLASVIVTRMLKKGIRKKIIIEYCLAFVGISMLLIGVLVPFAPQFVRSFITPLVIIFVGFGYMGVDIPTITFIQEITPSWFRGRVFGNLGFLITIINIFPVFFSGAISEIFGARTFVSLIGLGATLAAIYIFKRGQGLIEKKYTV
jgi:MFS family permease